MAELQLRLLGDLEVIRGNEVLALPPSRKTRGLLAFLALTNKPLRREHLCELLWEIPDDPRGSLRWSLSKIRKLVDDDNGPRIIANRSTVAFDTSSVNIDALALHRAAEQVESASVDELVHMAEHHQGAFLEGLDLTDFHDFHAWCIGERERTIRSQARVLAELCKRLADQPARALDYASALVSLTPYDESPRAELIRLLVTLDRQQEAEHQLKIGREKLAEVGVTDSGAFTRALRAQRQPAQAIKPTGAESSSGQAGSLVGRAREVQLLQDRINTLHQATTARLILIRGEPGIGKSRLLQTAAAMARTAGAGLLKASAFESEMIRPFGVWNDALYRALPDNATSGLLRNAEHVSRDQIFASLVEVLTQETQKRPVVVLCDDMQWADESSISAMHYVLRNCGRQPLLVIATSREVELKDNASARQVLRSLRADGKLDEIWLEPMVPAELEQLVKQLVPAADAVALSGACGGNPLLALELARAGLEGGHSLTELVIERISHMHPNSELLLQWAAVLAPRINVASLEKASELDQEAINTALEQAERQGILHPGERGLRFSHELIRQCIYDLIAPARQRAMHYRVAELLEEDAGVDLDLAADLSHHARLSGDPQLAGKAMVSAGKLCVRFYANDDALDLYRQGMAFAAQLADAQRVCLTLELTEIRINAEPIAQWQTVVDELVQLAEQAMDHGSLPHARLGYQMASVLRWLHGELRDAKRFSMQAERVSRGATGKAQILGMAEAAKCLALLERDLAQADAMVMEAQALARRIHYSCPAISISLGILRYYEDKFDEAVDYLQEARTQSKSAGDRLTEYMANEYLTIVEIERCQCESAHEYACVLVEIGERIRDGSERPFALALQALCHYALTAQDSTLDTALQELRHADAKQRLAFVLNRAAIHYLEHRQIEKAYGYANEALELARVMERPSEVLQAYINLERAHRMDVRIAPVSYREHIEQLAAGGIAGWVKKRSLDLLQEHV